MSLAPSHCVLTPLNVWVDQSLTIQFLKIRKVCAGGSSIVSSLNATFAASRAIPHCFKAHVSTNRGNGQASRKINGVGIIIREKDSS
jgi:hypothetical protein